MKFTSSTAGQITALKFYRSAGDTGSDLLDLWSSTGTKLASATFTNTSASGWQTVTLATPVSIAANTTYVASYHTSGAYVATSNFFTNAVASGPLTAPSSASSGGNGVYSYGGTNTAGIFPTSTFSASQLLRRRGVLEFDGRQRHAAGACDPDPRPERDRRLGLLADAARRHLHRCRW